MPGKEDMPVFDPSEVYEAFNNGEDLQKLALDLEPKKSVRPPVSKIVEQLTEVIKSERDRQKVLSMEEAKTDMIMALRQEISRLVKLRDKLLKEGVERKSTTEIIDTMEKEVVSLTEQTIKEAPMTAITNITREIRENRKLIAAILELTDSSAESDEAFEKALEEAGDEGVIIRGQEKKNKESSDGPGLSQRELDE